MIRALRKTNKMNIFVRDKDGYDFAKGLAQAQTHLAYHTEGLFVSVANAVIDQMENKGVTKSELANRLKITPSHMSRILQGQINLSLESLAKIAFVLGMQWECRLVPLGKEKK